MAPSVMIRTNSIGASHRRAQRPAGLRIALACLVVGAAACSPPSERADAPGGQVVARVGERELTVHQLNHLLAASRAPGDDPAARRLALEALVDQHLLAERARRDALDRDPVVLAQLNGATQRVLASASIERIAASAGAPGPDEVRAFHDAHPALFTRRRTYVVDELSIGRGAPPADAVRARAAGARRLDEVAEWLRERGAVAARREGAVRPEDIGPAAAATLLPLGEGALAVLEAAGGLQVVQIRRIESRPVGLAEATPWIEHHLIEQRRRVAVDREVAAMRREARIVLVGESGTPPAPARTAATSARAPADAAGGTHVDRGVGALR
jgi:EpsD family peptidyl-prolyl cis-trans isomerase